MWRAPRSRGRARYRCSRRSLSPLDSAPRSARICSQADITPAQISAGKVPPSTGAPPYSVVIGVLVSACPTQTQAVTSSEGALPQNQASPLFSVVPVFPHCSGSPTLARTPVPPVTTLWRIAFASWATGAGTTLVRIESLSPSLPGSW